MTDKPPAKTMLLTPYEWRALVSAGANTFYSFIGAMHNPVPDQSELIWFNDVLDRLKMQVAAWGASGQQGMSSAISQTAPVPEQPAMTDYLNQVSGAAANGTGTGTGTASNEPKKKRGWQKGRKRGPRTPKGEAVQ